MTLPDRTEDEKENPSQSPGSCQCRNEACYGTGDDVDEACQTKVMETSLAPDVVCRSQVCGRSSAMASLQSLHSPKTNDIECSSDLEHVRMAINGSNCPGCTRKIERALESIPFLYNLRMHAIPLQAEFDLDVSKVTVRETMGSIRKTTNRTCERIGDGWQSLQVVVPSEFGDFEESVPPYGVMDIERLEKGTFCLKYDAKKIGARQLLKSLNAGKDCPITLAVLKSHDDIPTDLRKAGYLTGVSLALTLPILILAWAPLPEHELGHGSASLVFATAIQIIVAGPFYPKALRSLFLNRVIDMDLLIVLSTSTAYTVSVVSFICKAAGSQFTSGMFFETSALLISLIMVGRFVADLACHRVIKSKSIRSLQPLSALLVDTSAFETDEVDEIDIRLLQFDDIIKVRPRCAVPTDGVVHSGESEFDESMITGEADLIKKSKGCTVVAGSINHSATVNIQVTRLLGENTIDEIADMVEEVSRSKPRTQLIADRVACWVVPLIGALTMLTLLVWILVGILLRDESAGLAILHAMPYAVSVLVVSCPCAIGLVIPIVQVVGGGVGAKYGVILRSAEVMTMARKVDHVVFDKTGTLTTKSLSVLNEQYFSECPGFVAGLVLSLTSYSEHPVSLTVAEHLLRRDVECIPVTGLETVIGEGVKGKFNDQTVRIGNARWLGVGECPLVQSLLSRSLTVMCAAQGDQLIAVFGLEATVRHDSAEVVGKLKERGIKVSIMSGDEMGAVQKIASELGIEDIWARCTPKEKQQNVRELMQSEGKTVLFCGDGVNDAAALTQASVGLHINDGTGITQSAADAVLTGASLNGILVLIDLSRDCYHQIIFGFSWSAFYNLFAILLAAGAFIKLRLRPEYAGLGEAVSVLPVIFVPLRLRWKKYL